MVKGTQETQEKIVIGTIEGLRIELSWEKKLQQCKTASEATLGSLYLWIGDYLIWGVEDEEGEAIPIQWNWIELLEFLALSWSYLVYEEVYPIDVKPAYPGELREQANQRWRAMPEDVSLVEDKEIYFFEDSHDLSRGLNGIELPTVFLMREGNCMWLSAFDNHILRPFDETLKTLEQLGDVLSERIRSINDPRSEWAYTQWTTRRNLTHEDFISLTTNLSIEDIEEIQAGKSFEFTWEYDSSYMEDFRVTELQAAARMISERSDHLTICSILEEIRKIPHKETSALDGLSQQAVRFLGECSEQKFYGQGYALANWFRKQPNVVSSNGKVEPKDILIDWGILLKEVSLDEEIFDAIACWGAKHGPAVLLNIQGAHNRRASGIRSTYAHEICHLLVDRQNSLPLVEILGGNLPWGAERRANAFSAELLLPRYIAAEYVKTNPHKKIGNICKHLSSKYGVSFHIIANQILNSVIELGSKSETYLKTIRSRAPNDLLYI